MAGIAVLHPSTFEWERMQRLLKEHSRHAPQVGDRGSQALWQLCYPRYHELPVAYNAFQTANLASVDEWSRVKVLHDISVHRQKVLYGCVGWGPLISSLTEVAWAMMNATFGSNLDKYRSLGFVRTSAAVHARVHQKLMAMLSRNATSDAVKRQFSGCLGRMPHQSLPRLRVILAAQAAATGLQTSASWRQWTSES